MKVGITGDTHGDLKFSKIYEAKRLGVTHLIICGDFGYIWSGRFKEQKQLEFLNKIGIEVLFLDGNHENHKLLNKYPISDMYGGRVHKILNNIIHLIRGEIYIISGNKYFVFGGANSTDIKYRKEDKDWWREEKPTDSDKENAYNNLTKYNWNVDYILTHTCYPSALDYIGGDMRVDDVSDYLNFIKYNVSFKYWFFGHMHRDFDINELKTRCVYKEIIIIE